jgi:putative SOS response-associated peptidase YedK
MCGRYRLARKKEILAETFDVDNDVEWSPRYNVAPGQNVPVVRQDSARPQRSMSLASLGTDSVLGEGYEGRIQNDQR